MRSARLLHALVLVLGLCCAPAALARPAFVDAIEAAADDDPRAAIALAEQRLQAGTDPVERFWSLLGLAQAKAILERRDEALATLEQASTLLAAAPGPDVGLQRLWLELAQRRVLWALEEPPVARERLDALIRRVAATDDPRLACEARNLDLQLLMDAGSLDEAWLAAEAVERCARGLQLVSMEALALHSMGHLAARGQARTQTDADVHFQRALERLGPQPARFTRSVVLWEQGTSQRQVGRHEEAMRHLAEARTLSLAIDDHAGIAAANISIAEVHLAQREPQRALQLLTEARTLLAEVGDSGFRLMSVAELTIGALAALKRPEVIAEIGRARRWDNPTMPAFSRMALAQAMAKGYASQGRYAEAYAESERAEALRTEGKSFATDVQTLRLQARYAAARRDAENAELRHRAEADRLALAAESATQRALWAALALLLTLAAALAVLTGRTVRHRRVLADLALRDELTGQPNRRSVWAYAQTQFQQARRLDVPLAVALIDLDHFKRINDVWGHARGDAVLRAFAKAAGEVLRGQDRLGRWGGEEWLLVMPGTRASEVPAVFERLRRHFAQAAVEGVDGAHGCTFSMGAAVLGPRTASLDALLAECDTQLYRAKADGRDTLRVAGVN